MIAKLQNRLSSQAKKMKKIKFHFLREQAIRVCCSVSPVNIRTQGCNFFLRWKKNRVYTPKIFRELKSYVWTGENQFFVNATKDSLSFGMKLFDLFTIHKLKKMLLGAGGGHFGLWLDADLNHGRSQKCATFDNV